ncbi:MAG: hypothetical protein A3A80_01210 [Candidatus Terrybacteria bacterium RIFCSPLOWO2_01_FULL_44_24]|uniref:Metallo-beta-lactamase domain-containing protein n=1 Tax=Candidatus Terrybacteria bacterium RIFCSPHIGHO2_01_FULL_43_35 TaxID=1802361 RepID=A0A1G2PFB6_9BACT|nr:MAG: hypothetical protein A2828_03590 [Candidatus Terrybacteria bacterium RIFCSPHIGHO2_01_FULL_43_35]OHA50413.1 MAG: hypothetical protein A3B75_02655 [Candidatus Terrybacteria bacterium RIFCSPHIGHO2_02_FULL_43_14]OHA51702.1 MAG: hypothetical protein A3A80_01210 [Candidatus Terrybacteria bacterium RIFCSPLOWO2_01_FULL_44_24]
MKLTVLGSGTMMLKKDKFPSSFLLEEGDIKLLLDCGFGAIARLSEMDMDLRQINAVFISHFHADHFGDAFNLVHARFVADLYENKPHSKLIFICPETTKDRFMKWREVYWPEPKEDYPLEFKEGSLEMDLGQLHIETFPVSHVPWFKSVGIRVSFKDKLLVYTGDIGSSHDFEDLVKRTQNADLLMIEAAAQKPTPNHFTLEQIQELTERAAVKKALIVHTRPQKEWQERIRNFIKDKPTLILAEDKMTFEI